MTKIYNITTGTATDISIIVDEIHIESDILGNMDITGPETGIHAVADDSPSHAGCSYYGDDESVTWWVDYVAGYNATLDDICDVRDEIDDSEKTPEEIADELGVDYARHSTATGALIEWLRDNQVDSENERGAFEKKLEELRAAL